MLRSRWGLLVGGIAIGFTVGISVSGVLPQVPVHAVATHGQENFALCTGPVDQDIEAVFFMDFLTGDLRAAVLSLQTRQFNSFFEYNVLKDFPAGIKNPKFLVVTGVADLRRGQLPLGQTVVYVAEATTGQVNAYGMPWAPGRQAVAAPVKATLMPLDRMRFRTQAIRSAG